MTLVFIKILQISINIIIALYCKLIVAFCKFYVQTNKTNKDLGFGQN